jgi:lupus La protein
MKVEFYLGDANLPTDTFLWNETGGATNNPVTIKKIHAFNRMKRFPDFDVVVAALKESKFLDVVEHKGEECVKRKVAYDPDTPRSKADGRSVYVKGFGDEEPSSQFDIENFFLTYGATRQVRLRRTEEKLFKGSVFVEWEDDETQQKFLALDPKPEWRGNPLKIMPKKAYMAEKEDEIKDGKMEPKESWGPESRGGRGRGYKNGRGGRDGHRGHRHNNRDRGDRDQGDRDPDDWKKRREEDQASGFKDDRRHRDNRDNRDKKGGRGNRHDRNSNGRNRDREDKNGYVLSKPLLLLLTQK